MRNQMFDNLRKVVRAEVSLTAAATPVSDEIDLELPRGYVARLRRVKFYCKQRANNNTATNIQMALINDPDDDETTEVPELDIAHDVIADAHFHHNIVGGTPQDQLTNGEEVEYVFSETEDVIVARPIRFNAEQDQAVNSYDGKVTVEYTLEQITQQLMLELLDIL